MRQRICLLPSALRLWPGFVIKTGAVIIFLVLNILSGFSQSNQNTPVRNIRPNNCLDPDISLDFNSVSVCQSNFSQVATFTYSNPINNPSAYSVSWNGNPTPGPVATSNAPLNNLPITISLPPGLLPGIYTGSITVTNDGGCTSPPKNITITILASPDLGNDTSISICSNSTLNLNGVYSIGSLSSSWTLNGNTVTNTSSVNQAGIYQLVVTNSDGCKDTARINLSVTSLPAATLSYPSSVCANLTPTVSPIFSGSSGGTYSGTPGLSINPITGVINAAASAGGVHTITYTIPAQGGCPGITVTASITIKQLPVITTQPADTSVCKFNLFSFTSGATGYPTPNVQWQVSVDSGRTFTNITGANQNIYNGGIANANQDMWIFRAVYSNECGSVTTRQATFRVTAPLNPQDNPISVTGCDGVGTVTFFASGNGGNGVLGSMWQYSPDGGNTWIDIPSTQNTTYNGNISNTYTFTPTASQNGYIFRLKFINGKCPGSVSGSATLTVNPIPTMNQPDSQVVCTGNTVQPVVFSGTANSYSWTNNNPSIGLAASGTGNIPFFTAVNTTNTVQVATITVTPIFTGGNPAVSCPGPPRTFTIRVNPAPTVYAGPSFTICQGGSLAISGTIGGSATSATWSAPSGTFLNPNSLSTTYTSAIGSGSVTLTLTTNDPDGPGPCLPVTSTTVISLSTPATVDAGTPQRVCSGGSVTLNGSIGGSATSATWSAPSGTLSNATSLNSTYTPSITTGSVMLTLTTNDPAGPCPYVSTNVFIYVDTRPTANAGSAQTTCSGAPITLAGSVGGSATSGTWSAPSGTFSNPNALNSTYTPTITSGTVVLTLMTDSVPGSPCPRVSSTVTITVNPLPIVTATGTPVSCNGGSNGTASASSSGSGLSYSWNTTPPQTGSSVNNLAAGTYIVTVTDNKGCKGTASVIITQPNPIVLTTSQGIINCAGAATGSVSVSASGGTPNYTYSWNTSPVQTSASVINLAAGTYTVTVTDSKGCSKTASVPLTQNTAIIPSETHTNVSCSGGNNGTATISASGGTAPYSGTGTITGLAAGTYTYTVTDALGCTKTINVVITQPTILNATATTTAVSCNGGTNGSVTITASGGTSPYTGTGTFNGLSAGTYTYTVTDANGCTKAVTFTISQPTAVTATETHVNVNCNGATTGTATISGSGGTGPYSGTGTFSGLAAGTYTYIITDTKGCTASVPVTITQPTPIVLTTSPTNITCFGLNNGSAAVSVSGGSPGYTYSWSTSPSQSTATATGLSPGNYTVTVTDSKGCTKSATVTITQPTILAPNETHQNVLCNGASTGQITINASGGTGPYTGTGTFSNLAAGTYTYTVSDVNGCTKTISVTITQPTVLNATATATPVSCNGGTNGSVVISASGGTAPYSGTGTFSGLSAGTYTYTVTDANGCTKTVTFTISQPTSVTASEVHTNVSCFGGTNGTATISASGGTGPYTGTGTINNLAAGTYTYTVTDSKGCTATVPVVITQPSLLVLAPAQTNVSCNSLNNGTASVTASGGTPGYTYSWNTSPSQSTSTISNLSPGNYTITVTDSKGCSKTTTVTITQPAVLTLSETHLNVLCNGAATGSATINASGGTAPYSGTGTFTGLTAGSYNYTVTDANGCSKTIPVTITQPTPLTTTAVTTNVSCNGGSNGSVTISASGGTLNYSGTGTFSGLSAGTYNYTVTDGNGCTKNVPFTITAPAILAASATPAAVSCNGGSNGSVIVSASGGTAPYTGTGTFSNLNAGTYFYTITDSKGCQTTVQAQVTQPLALSVTANPTNILCSGQSTGSVQITASGGTAPYTGVGNFGSLPAGTYTYTVTDSKGCSKSISFTITQPTPLSVTGNSTNVTCFGGNNGTATVSASGGTPPYSGAGSFTGLAAGTYNYTVTDANGCAQTYTATVTQPAAIVLTETHTPVTCNGGSNGTVTISATGGTAPYTGAGLISGLSAGTQTFTVTDARGCTASITVTITQPPPIIITETHTNVSCNGSSTGSATISATGGTGILTGTGTFTGLGFGPHVFTVTDANGCQASITVSITQGTTLVASAAQTNVSCFKRNNGSVTVTATGGTTPYSGTGTFNNLSAGSYTYYVTDANGCGSFVNITITQPDSLFIIKNSTNVSCFGNNTGSIQIAAQGGTSPYTGTGTFSNLPAGTYNYTVSDNKGCTATTSVIITQPPALTATGTPTSVSCNGGSDGTISIAASGGTTPYAGTGTFTGLPSGNYTYTVTDNAGCTVQVPFSITQPPALTTNAITQGVSCFNGSNGSVIISADGGTAPYTGTGTFTGLSAGNYTYNVSDSKGCTKSVNFSISQPSQLTASITSTQVSCYAGSNGTVTITAAGGTTPYTGTGTITGISAGTYFYTVTDANGCTVPLTASLTSPPQLVVTESHTQVLCNGGNDATVTINASGGTAPYTGIGLFTGLGLGTHDFTVTDANGCQKTITVNITQATSLTASETHTNVTCPGGNNGTAVVTASGGAGPYTGTGTFTGLTAGSYNYTVTDANNCAAIITVIITEPSPIQISANTTQVSCHGGSNGIAILSASGGTGPLAGTGTFTGLTAGTYTYTITDAAGCTAQTTINIAEPVVLTAAGTIQNVKCFNDNSGSITVTATGGTSPISGTGSFSGLAAGTYNYQVTDANGCTASITSVITEPSPLTLSETNTQILCNGGSNGTATISATGGTAPYIGTGLFTGLALGSHDFTVTDANGCQKTITVNITQASSLSVSETHTDVTCFGGTNGTAIVTATGGTGPYTGTGTFTNLAAGTYNYTVTDDAGCQAIAAIVIAQPSAITGNITKTDVSCYGGNNGSITLSATGGTAPYSGTGTFSGLTAGSYAYTITDAAGCSAQIPATISEPAILAASASVTDVSCFGDNSGSITISASGGTAPYTGTGNYTGLAAGIHTYTVSDANGCSISITDNISEPTPLSLTESHTQILCNGGNNGTAAISATGGTAPYTGTGQFTGLALGPHDFTVTDANGCQKTITVNITQASSLSVSEIHTDVTCFGGTNGTAILTATGGTGPYTGAGTFTNLAAGTYNYTVTDDAGCQAMAIVIIAQPSAVTGNITKTDVSCHGGNNGSITLSASGGTAPYSGAGTFTGLTTGSYSYTITDAAGCSAQIPATISEPDILSTSASVTDVSCFGDNSGSITIFATGGTAPYTGTGNYTGLAAGIHTYTVTDANGCSTSITQTISEPGELTLTETHTQIPCNGGSNGSATISATGGTAPYTGTGLFNGLALGPHDFTVTDAKGCQKTITINITQATTLTAYESHTDVSCFGGTNGTSFISASGGTGPYTGTGTFTGLAPGNYSYTVSDAVGCQAIISVNITEPNVLTANVSTTDVSCSGGSNGTANVTAGGGTQPYSGTGLFSGLNAGTYNYTITDANGCTVQTSAIIGSPNPLTATATPQNAICHGVSNGSIDISASGGTAPYSGIGNIPNLGAGSYTYTVTDANGCNTTVNAIITEPSPLILNETHTQVPCTGRSTATVTITATGGTGPYTGTGTFSGLGAGPHTFTVTDANGCQKNIIVIITQVSPINIIETHTDASCYGTNNGSITLTAGGGTGPYTGTGSYSGLSAGTYTYTVSDASGCSSTVSITITQPDSLTATLTKTDISCHGGTNGSITVSASGGTLPYSGTGSFTGLTPGNYNYTITDGNGCSAQLNTTIEEPDSLQLTASSVNPNCNNPLGGSILITATGGTGPYSGTGSFTGLGSGNYSYSISDQNNCTANISIDLTIPDSVNLQVNNPAAICGGTSADLTNSSITSGSSNGLSYTYWQDAGATIPLANPNAVTTSGTYYIQATNSSGCTEIKPVSVSILPLPSGRINGGGAICEGSSQNMVINLSGVAPFTITYSNGTTNYTISGINANSYILTVSPAITTTYTIVSVKDANCTNTGNNSTATITVNPNVAGIRYPDITAGVNTPTPVDARDFGNSYVYDWSPGIGLLSYSTRSTTFYYDQTVEYFIRISNGSGCDIVDTVKIIVENRSNDPKSGIWVPNAWSPNSSGKNDVLRPLCLNITQIKFFRIFNRWGQLMFETSRIGEGWNGIWNGKPQVNDVYTWTLEAYGIDGIRYFKSGNSILLR